MKYCVECGTAQNLTWKFCPHCGQGRVAYDLPGETRKEPDWCDVEPVLVWAEPATETTKTAPAAAPVRQYRPETVGENRRKIRAEEKRHNKYENRRRREQRKIEKQGRGQQENVKPRDRSEQSNLARQTELREPHTVNAVRQPEAKPVRRRRGIVLLVLALTGGLLSGAWFGGRALASHDSYRRSVEMEKLLGAVEASEQVMISWEKQTDAVTTAGRGFDDTVGAEIEQIAAEHLSRLEALRASFTDEGGLEIPVWHGAIRDARDRYVAHHSVWVSYLKAVSRDAHELGNADIIARIDDTFERACLSMRQVEDQPRFPNRSASNRERVGVVCRDAGTLRPI